MKKKRFSIILVAIIVGIVVLTSVGGYFGYKEIKSYQVKEAEKEKQNQELTNEEIETISKSIVKLICFSDDENVYRVYGSGIYLSENSITGNNPSEEGFSYIKGYVLTNGHVAQLNKITLNSCDVGAYSGNWLGYYNYNEKTHFLNENIDVALLKIEQAFTGGKIEWKPFVSEDTLKSFLLKYYPICPNANIVGSKIYVFGYPSAGTEYAMTDPCFANKLIKSNPPPCKEESELYISERNLIVFDGIISGVDSQGDFYTTAKIDSGVSGGLAVAKIDGEICIVGIPTWISGGEYENLGIIQSFQKIKDVLIASPLQ